MGCQVVGSGHRGGERGVHCYVGDLAKVDDCGIAMVAREDGAVAQQSACIDSGSDDYAPCDQISSALGDASVNHDRIRRQLLDSDLARPWAGTSGQQNSGASHGSVNRADGDLSQGREKL